MSASSSWNQPGRRDSDVSLPARASPSLCDQVHAELRVLKAALDTYSMQYGAYPSTAAGLSVLATEQLLDTGGDELHDPWGTPYVYERTPTGFALLTVGPDGERGTPDDFALGVERRPCPPWPTTNPIGALLTGLQLLTSCAFQTHNISTR